MEQTKNIHENHISENNNILFPRAALSVSRKEYYKDPLRLNIKVVKQEQVEKDNILPSSLEFLDAKYWNINEPDHQDFSGPLPKELHGHVFIVGTAGSFDSLIVNEASDIRLPTANGWQTSFAGDGIAYRLDFHSTVLNTELNQGEKHSISSNIIDTKGWASLATRILKTPDYYVDHALEKPNSPYRKWSEYDNYKFRDTALTRLSYSLGGRNLLNTGWVPMVSRDSEVQRLLVTWDAGRPYEINPCSLELVAPVGLSHEWKPMFQANKLSRAVRRIPGLSNVFPILGQVFPLIVSSAHPVYDENDEVVFGVNVTRSLKTIFQIQRSYENFRRKFLKIFMDPEDCGNAVLKVTASFRKSLFLLIFNLAIFLLNIFLNIFEFLDIGGRDHLFIYSWNGDTTSIGEKNVWEILNAKGRPIKIYQTPHQLALTEDYIIVSDSSFKIVLGDLISSIFNPKEFSNGIQTALKSVQDVSSSFNSFAKSIGNSNNQSSELPELSNIGEDPKGFLQLISSFLNYPQKPYTDIYIIPRPDRINKTEKFQSLFGSNKIFDNNKIRSKHFRITPETAHFTTDYKNTNNKIKIHAGHIEATDPAEFVQSIDQAVCSIDLQTREINICDNKINQELQNRAGSLINGLAPNRTGTWILNLENNSSEVIFPMQDDKYPFNNLELPFLGFLTHDEKLTSTITDIFWSCGGKWPYRLTPNFVDIYQDRINQDEINDINSLENASILHVNCSDDSMGTKLNIVDLYEFPTGFFGTSPQFIPALNNNGNSAVGYVVTFVVATDTLETDNIEDPKFCEFWIFNAEHLSHGPKYRLSHPKMNIGSTLHTTWLSRLQSPPNRDDYDVREDYKEMLNKIEPKTDQEKVKKLFEDEVYKHY